MNILVIEDDEVVRTLIQHVLQKNNYTVSVAAEAKEGERLADTQPFDCIILDLALPDKNGLELCKDFRDRGNKTPILILSARKNIDSKVSGLNFGADDYLTKPFDNKELLARIEAITRRSQQNNESNEHMSCGDLHINLIKREFLVGVKVVWLTNNEFNLMAYLMHNIDRVIDKEELADKVWGITFDTQTNFINVYVSYLRKKINEITPKEYIQTVRKRGFILTSKPDVLVEE